MRSFYLRRKNECEENKNVADVFIHDSNLAVFKCNGKTTFKSYLLSIVDNASSKLINFKTQMQSISRMELVLFNF